MTAQPSGNTDGRLRAPAADDLGAAVEVRESSGSARSRSWKRRHRRRSFPAVAWIQPGFRLFKDAICTQRFHPSLASLLPRVVSEPGSEEKLIKVVFCCRSH